MLDHERLDCYTQTLEFLSRALPMTQSFPRGYAHLADQLRRAATSIPLNIAEAAGRPSGADRKRFFAIARGSAMECGAVLDVCALLGLVGSERIAEAKLPLERVVAMLSKLCR